MYIKNIVQNKLPTTTSEAPVSTNGVSEAPVMTDGVPSQQKEAITSLVASAGPAQPEQISTPCAASVEVSETAVMMNGVPSQQKEASASPVASAGPTQQDKVGHQETPALVIVLLAPLSQSQSVPLHILKRKLLVKRLRQALVIVLLAPLNKSKSVTLDRVIQS